MSEVDLSLAQQGRVKLSDGREWWCMLVEPNGDGSFALRIEDGWYNDYWQDGRSKRAGIVINSDGAEVLTTIGASVVEFEPMDAKTANKRGLPSATHP